MPPIIETSRKQTLLNEIFWFNQYLMEQLPGMGQIRQAVIVKNVIGVGQDLHRSYAYSYDNDTFYHATQNGLQQLQMVIILLGVDYENGVEATMNGNGYETYNQLAPADYVKSNPNLARRNIKECNHA